MFHFFFYIFFLLRKCPDTGRSRTVVTRERSKINQSPYEMNQLHNHQLLTTCSSCFCNVVVVVVVVGSNHKVDSCTFVLLCFFFSPSGPRGDTVYIIPIKSHHCIDISRSLSKIVKYMCTYSTYIPPTPRVYLYQSADERLKSRLDQEKKDSHQTLKKEGSYSLPPPAERERPKDPNRHIPPYLYPS